MQIPAIQRAAKIAATLAAYAAGVVLVVLMTGTVADVLSRFLLNKPLLGVFDLTHFAVVIIVYLGFAYCTYYGGHAAVELLYERLSAPLAHAMDRIIHFAGAAMMGVLAWRAGVDAVQVQQFGQASQLLELPLYPAYWIAAFGSALTAAVMAIQVFYPDRIEKDRDS